MKSLRVYEYHNGHIAVNESMQEAVYHSVENTYASLNAYNNKAYLCYCMLHQDNIP